MNKLLEYSLPTLVIIGSLKPQYQIIPRLLFGLSASSAITGTLMIAISIFSLPVTTPVVTLLAGTALTIFVGVCFIDKPPIAFVVNLCTIPISVCLTKALGLSFSSIPCFKFGLLANCVGIPLLSASLLLSLAITKSYLNCIGNQAFRESINN